MTCGLGTLSELTGLQDSASREVFLDSRKDLIETSVVAQIAEAVRQHVRVDMHEALRLAEAGVAIAARVGDCNARALASRAKANALYMLGQNQSAVELHSLAIALFEEGGNRTELGRSLSASIQPLALLGQYDRALANAARAREIFAAQGDLLRLARLDINFANVLHRQDRFLEALECYRRAQAALWPDEDVEGVAVVLHNIAVCLIGLNDLRSAMDAYRQAREYCERHSMPLLVLQADYNIAALYLQRGEYGRALRRLQETRAACRNTGDEHHLALCDLDLSEIYLELNLVEEASNSAEEAFQSFSKLNMSYEAAKCLANRAVSLGRRQQQDEALDLFKRARDMFIQQENSAWPHLIDLYRAVLDTDAGRYAEASRLCLAAMGFFQDSGMPVKAALCELLLARIAWQTGVCDEALRLCRRAIQKAAEIGARSLQHQGHALLGRVLEDQGQFSKAWSAYHAAHLETETLRSSLAGEETKIAFMANKFDIYERLVALSIEGAAPARAAGDRSPIEVAFEYVEESKSRALRDSVFSRGDTEVNRNEGRLRRRARELRQELNWYRHQIEEQELGTSRPSSTRLRELQQQASLREREYQRLVREDATSAPIQGSARVASLAEIRAALPSDTALIEYFRISDQVVAFIITNSQIEYVPVSKMDDIAAPLRLLRFQFQVLRSACHQPARVAASLPVVTDHLLNLYRALFAPLRSYVEGCKKLVIVPHDVLHSVPFQALSDGTSHLIDSFAISYAPSASVLAFRATRPRTTSTGSLVLGVPDYRAPRIQDEVEAISGLVPDSEVYLGEHSTAAALRARGPESRYIHIASHGYFRADRPMFSGVRLADEYLDVYDFYQLRLPCELVTLSGCCTGLSALAKGDELLGLERGLLFAGARCVLLSMWEIDDRSTAALMPMFYGALGRHGDKAEALRQAQQDLRKDYPHPYYWAAFVLAGAPS